MSGNITGRTKIIAHIGVPTEGFTAPMIYNPYFEASGLDYIVAPMGCESADFSDFLRLFFRLRNAAGALITMPHKVAVVDLLDELGPRAAVCGACNAVRKGEDGRLIGEMFDGEGFVRRLRRRGRPVAGASALIVGSGGVGSAIAASLAEAGTSRLGLYDVNAGSSERLASRLRDRHPGIAVETGSNTPEGFDIVVNATPLGMKGGDPLPLEVDRIDPNSFVGEVVLKPEITPFLMAARARGCEIQVGSEMLFEQIPAYLGFFGLPPASPEELREVARIRY